VRRILTVNQSAAVAWQSRVQPLFELRRWRRHVFFLSYLILLCHITNRLNVSLKLLFCIGRIDRGLAFLVADLHLSDHLLNPNVASRQEVG
jgi:hypothetical protein